MRVLFNTYPVAFDCPGGGEIQLLKSKQALEALGVDVELFDLWRPQLRAADLVHYFSVQGGSMNFCDYVKSIGLPLVISPVLWLTAEAQAHFPLREIHDLLHRCDRVLPNSAAECEQLATFFNLDATRFSVVPNGVDGVFFDPADAAWFRGHFSFERPFLLNVANIEPRKNQLRLIQAVRPLGLDLILLGNVRDAAYYEACLREGGSWLHHFGCLEHGGRLLRSAYRACEAFVLPSLLETPGLAALEAAAGGARVVVTEVGSTREYFGPLAGYADPADVDSIRQAVQRKLAEPPDRRLQRHVHDHFTWKQTGRALLHAYQSLPARAAAA